MFCKVRTKWIYHVSGSGKASYGHRWFSGKKNSDGSWANFVTARTFAHAYRQFKRIESRGKWGKYAQIDFRYKDRAGKSQAMCLMAKGYDVRDTMKRYIR